MTWNTEDVVETVIITKKEYDSLKEDRDWRTCVENAGVDNWSGYEYAMEEFWEGRVD